MKEQTGAGRAWQILCLAATLAAAGCQWMNAPPRDAAAERGISSLFGPSIADLINQRSASEMPPMAEPKIIDQMTDQEMRSTLVYTPRHAQTEVLKEAVGGMLNPDGTIQDSIALNALIVQDKKEVVANILTVLQSLDNPTPQLLVEARIVEVTLTDDLEYEITHTLTIPNSPGALFQNTDITLKVPGAAPTAGQGAELHIRPWASADIRLDNFVRLLETKGKANILSNPNVIVAPGTEASIITGQEVPVVSQTVTGGSVSQSTVFKRVGIKLRVALQQITRDTARIEINPEVSTVTGFTSVSQGVSNPIISLRNVSSTLSLKDGETLTIGGLLQDDSNLNTRGIPGLQDIPKAGFLFQSKRDQKTKTQLIFFLRVHILPEGVPGAVRVHNPGEGMEEIGKDAKALNPNSQGQPSPDGPTAPDGRQP